MKRLALGGLLCALGCAGLLPQAEEPVIVEIEVSAEELDPAEVEAMVAVPFETALTAMEGVASVGSRSTAGAAAIEVFWPPGTDVVQAREATSSALQQVELPDGVTPPLLQPTPSPTVAVIVIPTSREEPISTQALASELRALPGITHVDIQAASPPRPTVILDAHRLFAMGLSPASVETSIRSSGSADLEELSTLSLEGGVRLSDIATLELKPGDEIQPMGSRGPVTVVDLRGEATPELQAAIETVAKGLPGALLHAGEPHSVEFRGDPLQAQGVLSHTALPPDTVWVPGDPSLLWSWSTPVPSTSLPGTSWRSVPAADHSAVAVLSGSDRDALRLAGVELRAAIAHYPVVSAITSRLAPDIAELRAHTDPELLAARRLSSEQVLAVLELLRGTTIGQVDLQLGGAGSLDAPGSAWLLLDGPWGVERVAVSELAEVKRTATPAALVRIDGQPAELLDIDLVAPVAHHRTALEEAIASASLPAGVSVRLEACPACP